MTFDPPQFSAWEDTRDGANSPWAAGWRTPPIPAGNKWETRATFKTPGDTQFEREIARGCEGIKPGWVRVNFNYFISEPVFEYLLDAVDILARDGWRLLPQYRFDPETGLWRHRGERGAAALARRHPVRGGGMRYTAQRHRAPESRLAATSADGPPRRPAAPPRARAGRWRRADFEALRWFVLPDEVAGR